ncbi:unnamed protein product [Amoebophrya sp. A25]|nr:unnamed protein product [Amoebophrya sp. A25]|eukprot:GSA25T00006586001.1
MSESSKSGTTTRTSLTKERLLRMSTPERRATLPTPDLIRLLVEQYLQLAADHNNAVVMYEGEYKQEKQKIFGEEDKTVRKRAIPCIEILQSSKKLVVKLNKENMGKMKKFFLGNKDATEMLQDLELDVKDVEKYAAIMKQNVDENKYTPLSTPCAVSICPFERVAYAKAIGPMVAYNNIMMTAMAIEGELPNPRSLMARAQEKKRGKADNGPVIQDHISFFSSSSPSSPSSSTTSAALGRGRN